MTSSSIHRTAPPRHGYCQDHAALTATLSRRELLGVGLGAVAGMLVLPGFLDAAPAHLGSVTRPELDVALKAARWIRAARMETPHGVTWPADPARPSIVQTDLYNGMPGVVLFYLEMYHATGDRIWLDDASAGATELISQLPDIGKSADCGLYTGMAGAAFVLEETHRATGDGKFRDAAKQAVQVIHAHAEKSGAGVAWTKESATTDIISGSAGIGLFLLWADRQMGDPANRALAESAGRRLVELAQPASGGLKWAVAPGVRNLYPNFSHGTAGVSYFLTTLYQTTGDRVFLKAALAGAHYLEAVANSADDGFKVFHHEPGGEDLYYLSWCHGPAGTSRLFYRLADATHDDHWMEMVRRSARATIRAGVPEQRSAGYWNNVSQCCGNAGVGEYFLALNRIMPELAYEDMTKRIAANTLERATMVATPDGDGVKWTQAENRTQPDVLVAQTGFMQGAAGVGALFLHLDAANRAGAARGIVWPDSPFV